MSELKCPNRKIKIGCSLADCRHSSVVYKDVRIFRKTDLNPSNFDWIYFSFVNIDDHCLLIIHDNTIYLYTCQYFNVAHLSHQLPTNDRLEKHVIITQINLIVLIRDAKPTLAQCWLNLFQHRPSIVPNFDWCPTVFLSRGGVPRSWQADNISPNKHETLTQCWVNAGPTSQTAGPSLARYFINVSCLLGCSHSVFTYFNLHLW